jgi:hypothetical protein
MFYSTKRQKFLVDQVRLPSSHFVRPLLIDFLLSLLPLTLVYFSLPSSLARRVRSRSTQGYAFKVITKLEGLHALPNLVFPTHKEQVELLEGVLRQNESKAEIISDATQHDRTAGKRGRDESGGSELPAAKRSVGSMVGLSGGQHMSYVEQNKSVKWVFWSSEVRFDPFLRERLLIGLFVSYPGVFSSANPLQRTPPLGTNSLRSVIKRTRHTGRRRQRSRLAQREAVARGGGDPDDLDDFLTSLIL